MQGFFREAETKARSLQDATGRNENRFIPNSARAANSLSAMQADFILKEPTPLPSPDNRSSIYWKRQRGLVRHTRIHAYTSSSSLSFPVCGADLAHAVRRGGREGGGRRVNNIINTKRSLLVVFVSSSSSSAYRQSLNAIIGPADKCVAHTSGGGFRHTRSRRKGVEHQRNDRFSRLSQRGEGEGRKESASRSR